MSPRLRTVAVSVAEMTEEDGLPAWREAAKAPCVGPHLGPVGPPSYLQALSMTGI
jgi:hypothetical protein